MEDGLALMILVSITGAGDSRSRAQTRRMEGANDSADTTFRIGNELYTAGSVMVFDLIELRRLRPLPSK